MAVTYSATVTITAATQEEVFEVYSDLVDLMPDLANSTSTAEITVEELDPAKLVHT